MMAIEWETTTNTTDSDSYYCVKLCPYCGGTHSGRCPLVKAIEYHKDGTIKRVEFLTPGDYSTPQKYDGIKPPYDITISRKGR